MRGIKEKNCRKFKLHKSRFAQDAARRGHYFELLFTLAVCALLLAGRGFDYWRCIYLAKDALDCIRPSMGVMLFGSLIMQAIDPKGENQD